MKILCRLVIVGLVSLSGTWLPMFTVPHFGKFINLWWESVYGLGFFVVGFLPGGFESRVGFLFGALLWPIAVAILMYLLSGWILHSRSQKTNIVAGCTIIISLLLVVPLNGSAKFPFSYLPLYSHFMFVIY